MQIQVERCGHQFHLVHATPSNPHYGNLPQNTAALQSELEAIPADFVLVGHSHVPFLRQIGSKILLNPGSIGQPRSGFSNASYAVWQDGTFELKSYNYPVNNTVEKINALALPKHIKIRLAYILMTGVFQLD